MAEKKYVYAVWRRKTASAQVRLFAWKWDSTVNGKSLSEYFSRPDLNALIFSPLKVLKQARDSFYVEVKTSWSGVSSQAWAVMLWLSRALVTTNVDFKPLLKEAWLLTRDARKVERKKPGKHKARKSMQWSKR